MADLFIYFWLLHMACRILAPQPGLEPVPPAVEEQSFDHWGKSQYIIRCQARSPGGQYAKGLNSLTTFKGGGWGRGCVVG